MLRAHLLPLEAAVMTGGQELVLLDRRGWGRRGRQGQRGGRGAQDCGLFPRPTQEASLSPASCGARAAWGRRSQRLGQLSLRPVERSWQVGR